jgi:hypothetical protein
METLVFGASEITEGRRNTIATGATGVDTVRLFYPFQLLGAPDFWVLNSHSSSRRNWGSAALWQNADGVWTRGVMAVRQANGFRFRIAPTRPGGEARLRVFFSAPRVYYGDNSHAIKEESLRVVFELMEETLRSLNVAINWREGQISRLDICRDVLLPRPFHYYLPALYLIEPRYGRLWQNYPTGVVRGTATKTTYSLYDKQAERHVKQITVHPIPVANAWLRCECRLPTAAAVRDHLHMGTVAELVEEFDTLSSWFDDRVTEDLFPSALPDYVAFPPWEMPTYSHEDEVWWRTQLMSDGHELRDKLAYLGLRLAFESLGPQRFWELAKQECSHDHSHFSKFRRLCRDVALHSFSDQLLPVAQLYDELRSALLTKDGQLCHL